MIRNIVRGFLLVILLFTSITPASATQEVNCGKAKINKSGLITNPLCSNFAPNLGAKTRLQAESPNIMKLTKKSLSELRLQNALCADINRSAINGLNQKNIVAAFLYQFSKLDLKGNDSYKVMATIIVSEDFLSKFVEVRCDEGRFVDDTSNSSNSLKIAQELVNKNTKLQDSCFFTRTTNGNDPAYAREYCLAQYPNSLQWALSLNHEAEENCYNTRVFNGDNPITARSICLARYPIRN